ncbi:MAG: chemotaxis protein CheD [Halodesulfurarchaeum sp.]|nr:chemotaxis protein CheD [Halodesulfurarchaeum sp.]
MGRAGEQRIRVGVADMAVTDTGTPLVTSGLGSCVAIGVHDGDGVAGLLHAMLPAAPEDGLSKAKYVDSGIQTMKAELTALGADPNKLTAKIAGGSSMLNLDSGEPVGDKNVAETNQVLDRQGIELAGDDTGGNSGRSVTFQPRTGTMHIQRVDAAPTEL